MLRLRKSPTPDPTPDTSPEAILLRFVQRVARQRKLMVSRGATKAGYCVRYGKSSDDPHLKLGLGGEAIYKADLDTLKFYEAQVMTLVAKGITLPKGTLIDVYG